MKVTAFYGVFTNKSHFLLVLKKMGDFCKYLLQGGWKEPDNRDQKSCPVLSHVVRFFPTLSGFFQHPKFSLRLQLYPDN